MPKMPKQYGHFIFAVVQSWLTCGIATGISHAAEPARTFVSHWLVSWLLSWATMVPVVLFATPLIRRLVTVMTTED
jgi:hypothetical protein